MSQELQLLEVQVQPVFVLIEDGKVCEKRTAQVEVVPAAEWADYPAVLERRRRDTEAQLG